MLPSNNRTSKSTIGLRCALIILSTCLLLIKAYFDNDSEAQSNEHIFYDDNKIQRREKRRSTKYKGSDAFLINTPGCKIPNFGKKIKYKESKNFKGSCGQRAIFVRKVREDWRTLKLVFEIDEGKLRGYLKRVKDYECCYSLVERSTQRGREDSHVSYKKCKAFTNGTKIEITHEVITVKCYKKQRKQRQKQTILYDDAYVFIKRMETNSMAYNEESWNVLVIGIDTMSRARMLSAMPKLAKHLQRQGWLDYKGYHKVARNTLPNLLALLTGKNADTMANLCKLGMENCNDLIVWSRYSQLGYITAFGEDFVRLPDTLSVYHGFKTQPTHHYMRPFFLTGEAARGNLICTKHQSSAKHIFDYAQDFADTYLKRKFFGMFWINSICHNTAFLPSLYENDIINFIMKLSSTGALNNTFILLLSDHGIRFGPNRMQVESYYDDRLPMLFIWVPIEFRNLHKEQYHNMELNQQRLITPYDVYLTLAKIADMSGKSSDIVSEACPKCNHLFEEKTPYSTCDTGGVEKWCGCHSLRNADTFTDIDVLVGVHFAVSLLQNRTRTVKTHPCSTCYSLLLNKVHRVHSFKNEKNQKHYVIALQMIADDPDKAKEKLPKMSYEVTLLKNPDKFTVLIMEVLETYTSMYCTRNKADRGFCLCKYVKNCFRKYRF